MTPGVMMGKPVIRGTRVTVEILLRKLSEGMTDQQILAEYPSVVAEDIREAEAFAADCLAGEEIITSDGQR
jgi:uncharacterized protein (DUF433 family)